MEEVINYIKYNFDLTIDIAPLNDFQLSFLPLYLKSNYDLFKSSILEQDVIWAKIKPDVNLTPEQLKKQDEQLKRVLGYPIIFVFDNIESWERKRLIERRISFVHPSKQLYLPGLFLQLNDSMRSKGNKIEKNSKYLTPPTQCVILYHLEIASLEKMPLQEIAKKMQYSTMTISRVVKELQYFDLITIEGIKEKSIRFNLAGMDLWQKVLPLTTSPVREIWFTDQYLNDNHFRIGGDTALAAYTMLSESNRKTYAIGKDEFRSLKKSGSLKHLDKKYGDNRMEVWLYNPVILSKNNNVDQLSLYLSLKHEEDERVKGALEDLINDIQW